mmetsp:Transcript_20358/g.49199  ORF Transcript_20358/g.49199 Transcript_20358/m.49199 type:complete len:400 (+) Transcript_20358:5038-6237(+)
MRLLRGQPAPPAPLHDLRHRLPWKRGAHDDFLDVPQGAPQKLRPCAPGGAVCAQAHPGVTRAAQQSGNILPQDGDQLPLRVLHPPFGVGVQGDPDVGACLLPRYLQVRVPLHPRGRARVRGPARVPEGPGHLPQDLQGRGEEVLQGAGPERGVPDAAYLLPLLEGPRREELQQGGLDHGAGHDPEQRAGVVQRDQRRDEPRALRGRDEARVPRVPHPPKRTRAHGRRRRLWQAVSLPPGVLHLQLGRDPDRDLGDLRDVGLEGGHQADVLQGRAEGRVARVPLHGLADRGREVPGVLERAALLGEDPGAVRARRDRQHLQRGAQRGQGRGDRRLQGGNVRVLHHQDQEEPPRVPVLLAGRGGVPAAGLAVPLADQLLGHRLVPAVAGVGALRRGEALPR